MIKHSDFTISICNRPLVPKQVTRDGIMPEHVFRGAEVSLQCNLQQRLAWVNVDIYLLHNGSSFTDKVHSEYYDAWASGAEIFTMRFVCAEPGKKHVLKMPYKSKYDEHGTRWKKSDYKPLRVYGETSAGEKFMFHLAPGPVPELKVRRLWCFIATAAYEDAHHPAVNELRRVRDEVLRPTRAGRAFIKFYYRHSPRVAAWMANRPRIKRATRAVLTPLARSTQTVSALRREGWRSLFQNKL